MPDCSSLVEGSEEEVGGAVSSSISSLTFTLGKMVTGSAAGRAGELAEDYGRP